MPGKGPPPRPRILRFGEDAPSSALATAAPVAPGWLDGVARAKWDELAPLLLKAGVLTAMDRDILTCYCSTWADYVECTRLIAEGGRTVKSQRGGDRTSPYVVQQRAALNQLRLLGSQLGLTPEGRLRLRIVPPRAEADPFAEFLEQGSAATEPQPDCLPIEEQTQ